jgi:hypothetical protein
MKLSTILMLVGLAVLGYAYSLAPYKDEALFTERYMAMTDGQSNEYSKLRDEMLTPKFQLQDYGGTLVALSIGVLLVSRKGWRNLQSPKSRATLLGLAFAAPFLTVGAYAFDLFQGFARIEFPHWADSMAIPLMGVPVLLVLLLAWSGAHLAFLRGPYHSELLSHALSRQANWWLLAVAAMTAALAALFAAVGQYWYAVPGFVWLYFYISLAASRRSTHDAEPGSQQEAAR